MRSERVKDALDGIRINIEAIRAFVDGMTYKSFAADLRTFYAVTRALEIISEASRRLPDDLKALPRRPVASCSSRRERLSSHLQ